ncbi:MAG TPA: acyl-CoA dehydrogenase family protein [Jatrophihabitans sp.]|jgi:alkylation response protein AidB-like acyl-CoA dehydrogenase
MDFDLTEEQRLLADTVKGLLDKRYDANARLALLDSELGWSRELWKQYAELGLLGLAVDEQYGGAGMGPAELAIVMESFGRALVLEPFLSTVVLGGSLVAEAGTAEQKQELLPKVAAGELLLAFACTEPGSRWSFTELVTTAKQDGERWTLNGEKIAVLGGDSADVLVVTARTDDGIGLFLVDAADVIRASYAMQDGLRGADILLTDAPATLLGTSTDALAVIDAVVDRATAALCAEAVGAMGRMLTMTVDYLKTRVQFGQPIAVFQALQFRSADMYVSLEQARSMTLLARLALSGDDPAERQRLVQAAKIQIDLAGKHISQEAIQLHGGIGMTMEYPVGHYAKRVTVIAKTFADTDTLLAAVGSGEGLVHA